MVPKPFFPFCSSTYALSINVFNLSQTVSRSNEGFIFFNCLKCKKYENDRYKNYNRASTVIYLNSTSHPLYLGCCHIHHEEKYCNHCSLHKKVQLGQLDLQLPALI